MKARRRPTAASRMRTALVVLLAEAEKSINDRTSAKTLWSHYVRDVALLGLGRKKGPRGGDA